MSCRDSNFFVFASFILTNKQEICCRCIGSITVISDIRVNSALFVVYADSLGVAGFPLHFVGKHTINSFTVVDRNNLLQTHVCTQCREILKSQLIAGIVDIALHFSVVIHFNSRISDILTCTASCPTDFTSCHIIDNLFQNIRIIHSQKHGINTPVCVAIISCIDCDSIGFFQTCGFSCCEGDFTVGNVCSIADRFTGFLNGILYLCIV